MQLLPARECGVRRFQVRAQFLENVRLRRAGDDLVRGKIEELRQAMVGTGIPSGRINVDGVGDEDPVADNSKPKGRLANRRVEVKLFVPR